MKKMPLLFFITPLFFAACAKQPPADVDNVCRIFKQYPSWQKKTHAVAHRWDVPVAVQMAIVHQESRFNAHAKPKRTRLLGFIPWTRPSTAYGYAQVLNTTWKHYKQQDGSYFASRNDFGDAVDFIGWYVNKAHERAHIPKDDAYHLYLAYHEGIGGFERQSYRHKPWLMEVAHKVNARAKRYDAQLRWC